MRTLLISLTVLCLCLHAQDNKPYPGVDQKKVDEAIDKGAEWLLKREYKEWAFGAHGPMRHHDLVLYTLLHAGVDRNNAVFQKLLKEMLETKLTRTYLVSLQAMFLQEFDARKYQWRIAQCCQFLVDNQCENGQWDYGEETKIPKDVPTFSPPKRDDVATSGKGKRPPKKKKNESNKPKKIIEIKPYRTGKERGDNSNSQYAALGLRACMEANVFPPRAVLEKALEWWEEQQSDDGGWCYRGADAQPSYGSMSCGALGSVIIYRHYLKKNWNRDEGVAKGVRWIAENFDVENNPGRKNGQIWYYYYLYAVERAGILSGLKKFGKHDWYKTGANKLLEIQKDNGSWVEGNSSGGNIKDTCFAILFLRRATIPLPKVASGPKK